MYAQYRSLLSYLAPSCFGSDAHHLHTRMDPGPLYTTTYEDTRTYLATCQAIDLASYQAIYVSSFLSIAVYLAVYLAAYIYPSIHPFIHPSIHLAIYLCIYRSIYLSTYLLPPLPSSVSRAVLVTPGTPRHVMHAGGGRADQAAPHRGGGPTQHGWTWHSRGLGQGHPGRVLAGSAAHSPVHDCMHAAWALHQNIRRAALHSSMRVQVSPLRSAQASRAVYMILLFIQCCH